MFKEELLKDIHNFLFSYFNSYEYEIFPITDSASDRKYFKIKFNNVSYVLTFSNNIPETHTFLYFSEIFRKEGVSVPEILKVNNSQTIYLQEDLGDQSLFSILAKEGESLKVKELYKQSLDELFKLQFLISGKIDYFQCFDFPRFNKYLIINDLNYFKFYFFMPLEIPYSNCKLLQEFLDIGKKIEQLGPKGFMFRDFQSRNIMVKGTNPYFIDYQGGMQGNPLYDLASLLWQAKAQLSQNFKEELKSYYIEKVKMITYLSKDQLEEAYQYCLLVRLLQVLGVYGFRGILQQKLHFVDSIFFGIHNLKYWMKENTIIQQYPELSKIIYKLFSKEVEVTINGLIKK